MPNQITVLNVAEKNSVAKEVSRLLCNGRPGEERSESNYCKNYRFNFTINGMPADMIFSSVAGHLLQLEFPPSYSSWQNVNPAQLYDAPIQKQVNPHGDCKNIKKNLQKLAPRAQWLVLWLDCDREGESIAFEVIDVCREVNPRLVIKRARFSALIQRDIFHAISHLVEPDQLAAQAVDVRQELDLRIGASFTRLQTLLLRDRFDWTEYKAPNREYMLLSYGPCQFPTLGLIVQREWEIQAHISENFWSIEIIYKTETAPRKQCTFKWHRNRLFDHPIATLYHERCTTSPTATVLSVEGSRRTRNPPHPLCTLEMQKRGSQYLRISGERIMKLAEELYQGGFISYPRTETNLFAQGYDLQGLVAMQAQSNREWSAYSERLLSNGEFRWPASGGKDDGAHPPIHPTKPFTDTGNHEKMRLYEFIVRYFLACCSPPAEGQETRVKIEVAEEEFHTSGLMVTARHWLDVIPWQNWGGGGGGGHQHGGASEALPVFVQGQTFTPADIRLTHGSTQPPPRMRETDLLAKMDEYGIGTDATVADHIAKQLDRGYAVKDEASLTFRPTPLGQALISAYKKMGLSNLWMPSLRGAIEQNINAVALGQRSKDDVLNEAMLSFKTDFLSAARQQMLIESEVRDIVFDGAPAAHHQHDAAGNIIQGEKIATCPVCGFDLVLVQARDDQNFMITCTAPVSLHKQCMVFPRSTQSMTLMEETCASCSARFASPVRKVDICFRSALLPPTFQHLGRCQCCIMCDNELAALMRIVGLAAQPRRPGHGGANGSGGGRAGPQRGGRGDGGNGGVRNGGVQQGRGGRGSARGRRTPRAQRGGRNA